MCRRRFSRKIAKTESGSLANYTTFSLTKISTFTSAFKNKVYRQLAACFVARVNQGMEAVTLRCVYWLNMLSKGTSHWNLHSGRCLITASKQRVLKNSPRLTTRQNLLSSLHTASVQYVPKILLTQATQDCLATNKTKNALHKETVILNYISGGDPIRHSLSN